MAGNLDTKNKLESWLLFFATLAIFISCLGLFGVASFVAEQRTKEIGVRKSIGCHGIEVWKLLSKEFIVLVTISLLNCHSNFLLLHA